jgi:hypothetical protein
VKHSRTLRLLAIVGSTAIVGAGLFTGAFAVGAAVRTSHSTSAAPSRSVDARVRQAIAHLPLRFVQNQGQIDRQVALYSQGQTSAVYFTAAGVKLSQFGTRPAGSPSITTEGPLAAAHPAQWTVEQRFLNTTGRVLPTGVRRTSSIVSYFTGAPNQWRTGLPTYATVLYRDVWPGIDVEYSGRSASLEYTFIVHPGADPRHIALAYRGAASVSLDGSGRLAIRTPLGGYADQPPVAYQVVDGRRQPVSALFARAAGHRTVASGIGFRLGRYDTTRTLVIDPVTIAYSGYVGGYLQDLGLAVAIDPQDNAYVVGQTNSAQYTFPVRIGPSTVFGGQTDSFVCKIEPAGTLQYCGYIGGKEPDRGRGVAVNALGEAYVLGWTRSTEDDGFPVLTGPSLHYHGGSSDAFLSKVAADGRSLKWSGFVGGNDHDEGKSIALDASSNAYITGGSKSEDIEGIPSSGVAQPQAGGNGDTFVLKVSSKGALITGTYLGGGPDQQCQKHGDFCGEDHSRGISVVDAGSNADGVYVDGDTHAAPDTFNPVVGPSLAYGGNGDAYAARLPLNLSTFVYKGYVGGNQYEDMRDNTVDAQGNAYLCGHTASKNFPVVVGPGTVLDGDADAFVTKVSPDGTHLVISGFIGGAGKDSCYGINVDASGNIYIGGHTASADFPVLNVDGYPDSLGTKYLGGGDAFVTEEKANGTGYVFSGFFGGHGNDVVWATDRNLDGSMVITGSTSSTQDSKQPFPLKLGPDLFYNGATDAFISLITSGGAK